MREVQSRVDADEFADIKAWLAVDPDAGRWQHTASLMAAVYNAAPFRSGGAVNPERFMPRKPRVERQSDQHLAKRLRAAGFRPISREEADRIKAQPPRRQLAAAKSAQPEASE